MPPDVPEQYRGFIDRICLALVDAGDAVMCVVGELGSDVFECEGVNAIVTVRSRAAKPAEAVDTAPNSAMDAICTCSEALCRYRSATEPNLCLDPTELCKYKQHQ